MPRAEKIPKFPVAPILRRLPPEEGHKLGVYELADGTRWDVANYNAIATKRAKARKVCSLWLSDDEVEAMMLTCAARLTAERKGAARPTASLKLASMLYLAVFCKRNKIGFKDVDDLTAQVSRDLTWRQRLAVKDDARAAAKTQVPPNGRSPKPMKDDDTIPSLPVG